MPLPDLLFWLLRRLIVALLISLWAQAPASASPPPAATQQRQQPAEDSLYGRTPAELEHKDVLGVRGERLGRVGEVVSARRDGRIHVVIIRGGFMGVPATAHAFPLEMLTIRDGSLRLPVSEAQLRARDLYREKAYIVVSPKDRPISEFSALKGPAPGRER